MARVEAGESPRQGEDSTSVWESEVERLFTGVRVAAGPVLGEAGASFVESSDGRRLLDGGVLEVRAGRLVVTDPLLTDGVAREILGMLET